ncbi:30S ribosome-binding factor RbfA [Haloplasma contractile]|uniref:Ribosome-binding factor A n=1 Tax=Haloplasma contractile SSD-17B TaxID=1033810 RepID=U2FLB0_9MOLU|nr:30S ribosome-binding factor RbfA [Haloplasma contractile]ERJ13525.1 Ribosome-binding factor A protein [Haloplasma contractile SSD-17B]
MSSVRVQKVAKQIEREVSKILQMEVKDKRLNFITVTGVDLSNDYSFAKIHYTVLGNEDKKEAVANGLEKAKGFIRSALSSRVQIRKLPELIFTYDESIEYGNKIQKMLNQLNK